MFTISASSINAFLFCRTQWFFRHVRKLRPRTFSESMIRGEVVHAMIEAALNDMKDNRTIASPYFYTMKVSDKEVSAIREREQAVALFGQIDEESFSSAVNTGLEIGTYFIQYVLPDLDWEVLATEIPFKIINENSFFTIKGRVDALVKSQGKLYVVDLSLIHI